MVELGRVGFELMARPNKRGGAPSLVSFSHGPAGLAVGPLVELPLVVAAELVELREAQQLTAGDVMKTEPVDESHPHAADKRPDAAVVIVMRQVQQVDG